MDLITFSFRIHLELIFVPQRKPVNAPGLRRRHLWTAGAFLRAEESERVP